MGNSYMVCVIRFFMHFIILLNNSAITSVMASYGFLPFRASFTSSCFGYLIFIILHIYLHTCIHAEYILPQ